MKWPFRRNADGRTTQQPVHARTASAAAPREAELEAALGRARVLHHQPERIAGSAALVEAIDLAPADAPLVQRVQDAYGGAITTRVGQSDSIWLDFFANANAATHETLASGDTARVTAMLRNPAQSMLFYGFDNLSAAEADRIGNPGWQLWMHQFTYSCLHKLAEASGVIRLDNPEAPYEQRDWVEPDELLAGLDKALGFRIDFPNFFQGEMGIRTSRGVASYRAVQALYQVFRLRELLGDSVNAHVLEIGGGLGRTAYYAHRAGISRYTIIDLPLTNVAQGYFLGRALGAEQVELYRETGRAPIRILPPASLSAEDLHFDLAMNIDSLTEMSRSTAIEYLDELKGRTPALFSINHEHNAFTVRELCAERGLAVAFRMPCWVRRGYVEEFIRLQ